MTGLKKTLIVSLSALALLSGCDETGSSSSASSWTDWFKEKSEPTAAVYAPSRDYVQETQAGNYLAGQFAQYRQDWSIANKYLDKVMTLDPTNMELQQRAMILAMQAGDTNRAIALARKVLAQDDKNVIALLFIGMDQIARQEYSDAIKTIQIMPENGVADFIRPILIAWAKTPEGAKDDETLVSTGSLHAYHALLIADYLGEVKDADKYFINILASGGVDSHVLEMMADVFARQGKDELAKKIYDTLLLEKQKTITLPSELSTLQAKRDNPASVGNARKITTPAQGAAEAFYNMARILYQEKSDDSALVFSRIADHLDSTKEDNKVLMARMMLRNGHLDESIAFYKTVKPDSSFYLEAQRSAAELMEQNGKLDEAVASLENLYTTTKDLNSLIQIGDLYRRADRQEEAIKAYDRAEAAMGGTVPAEHWQLLYARGMSYEQHGDMAKAESDLEKALAFKPDHPYLLNYLGYSWADQGKKLDEAMELIAKAAKLRPDDGYIIDSLGWVYFKTGRYPEAVAELEKAIELVPFDATINDHLGDAFWQVGRKQEARFQWNRAINHSKDEKLTAAIQSKIDSGLSQKDLPVQQAKKESAIQDNLKR